MFDLCFVLYNSEKWLKACVESFTKVNYDKKKLALYFADNQSTDNTLTVLEGLKNNMVPSLQNLRFYLKK